MTDQQLQITPHSLTLEQAILAGLMAEPEVFDDVSSIINGDDFYNPRHRMIFEAVRDLARMNQACDALLVSKHMQDIGTLAKIGGESYLAQILRDSPATTANIMAYAGRMREFTILRNMIKQARAIMDIAYNTEGRPIHDVLDFAESAVMAVRDGLGDTGGAVLAREVAVKTLQVIDARFHSGGELPGISTGYLRLDQVTLGLERKRLVIIGGRPSQGKTTLMMNIIENIMLSNDERLKGQAGLLFTMEMENESIVENMFASLGRVGNYRIRSGQLEDGDWHPMTTATTKIKGMSLYMDDRAGRTLQDMRAEARKLKRKHPAGLAFIAVDYLQRMGSIEKFGSRTELVGSFSRGLKRLAQDFDCPVIALAQLNRANGQRPNKRPGLSDLRDSGEIEQDGDLIMFIHREESYNPTDENRGKAELIIAKQRKGMCETVPLHSNLQFCRFEDVEHRPENKQ